MKTLLRIVVVLACAAAALPVIAHHMAEGIVDEEIYAMIDAMVADTPHAELDLTDLGDGMTDIDIVTRVQDLETMVAAGLLDAVAMLDGDVTMTIDFTGGRDITIEILQDESSVDADKAAPERIDRSFGSVKADFR